AKTELCEYLLDTLLTGTEEEREAVVAGTRKEVAVLERRLSGFKDREQSDSNHGSGSCELAG
ncbi:MAG: DNA primase, partial [Ruminococcus callidus]|nr:DNA primase [Ruminococcus callidus]